MEVLVEAGSADDALASLRKLRRRGGVVALVALGMGGQHDSIWLIRELRDVYPGFSVLAFSDRAEQGAISRALFAGADGFAQTDSQPFDFVAAVRAASRGEIVLHGIQDGSLGAIAERIDEQLDSEHLLTDRERQILTVATEGLTARQIGTRLGVRERTVTTHLAHIYKKLGVSGRISAIAVASRAGLVAAGSR
jgi:DNA-binding NarL/FixJ family response regulator